MPACSATPRSAWPNARRSALPPSAPHQPNATASGSPASNNKRRCWRGESSAGRQAGQSASSHPTANSRMSRDTKTSWVAACAMSSGRRVACSSVRCGIEVTTHTATMDESQAIAAASPSTASTEPPSQARSGPSHAAMPTTLATRVVSERATVAGAREPTALREDGQYAAASGSSTSSPRGISQRVMTSEPPAGPARLAGPVRRSGWLPVAPRDARGRAAAGRARARALRRPLDRVRRRTGDVPSSGTNE